MMSSQILAQEMKIFFDISPEVEPESEQESGNDGEEHGD